MLQIPMMINQLGSLCCLRSPDVIEASIAAAEKLKPLLPQVEG
jgi:hypothetical protein